MLTRKEKSASNLSANMDKKNDEFLLTGATGLLGDRLLTLLLQSEPHAKIHVICRTPQLIPQKFLQGINLIQGDLRNKETWQKIPTSITHVFHTAAAIPWEKSKEQTADNFLDNILPIVYLIEQSEKWPHLKQVIFSSTISVFAPSKEIIDEKETFRPANMYNSAKLAGEQALLVLRHRGVGVATLRYSSMYGFGQYQGTVMPLFINRAIAGLDLTVKGDGTRKQDFIYCQDAAVANYLAYKEHALGAFNIGSGISTSMYDLAIKVKQIFANKDIGIALLPQEDGGAGYIVDISLAKQVMGYTPAFSLEQGMRKLKSEMHGGKA